MNANIKINDFGKRLKTMLKVDFRRMFTMPTVYIMLGISLALPIIILVMTSFMGGMSEVDPQASTQAAMFTNVWQAIGSAGGNAMSMDITSMCNINLLYFLVAIFVCLFVGEDFRSGYVKNLFTVRAKKLDYVLSKTIVLFAASVGMFVLYFIGAMIGGGIAGLSFDVAAVGASAGGIIACMISKLFFALVFVSIALTLATVGKQKLWLSILGSLAAGMLLFTMIPMMTPLNSGAFNVILCVAGGPLFAAGLGAISNVILSKTSLV